MEQELNKILQQLQKLGVSAREIQKLKDTFNSVKNDASAASTQLDLMRARVYELGEAAKLAESSFKDITSILQQNVQALDRNDKSYKRAIKSQKFLRNLSSELLNDEEGITALGKKRLEQIIDRAKKEKANIDFQSQQIAKRLSDEGQLNIEAERGVILASNGRKLGGTALDQKLKSLILSGKINQEEADILKNKQGGLQAETALVQKAKERLKQEEKIQESIKGFSAVSDLIGAIPGLRKFAGPFQQAQKAAEEAARQGLSQVEINKAGMEELQQGFVDLFTSPLAQLAALASLFKSVLNIALEVDKQTTEIGKSQALSAREAANFRRELFDASISTSNLVETTKSLLQAQTELAAAAGATRGFKLQELKDQTMLTKRVGIQAEAAANLANLSRVSNQTSEQALDNVIKQTAGLKAQTGIQLDNRAVLEEVADTNGQIAATLGNNPSRIAAAVVQVRRLGLSLEQARSVSESLLDFQSSIESELEAELLTGKELNLERARALALQGDFAGAAAEVASQAGSLAEFQNMNVLAQQALAQAVGMTVDELATSLQQQENLNKLGEQTKKDILARVEALKAEGKVAEANNLLSKAADEESAKAALMRLDAQQKFNLAMEKLQNLFTGLANNMGVVLGILGAIAGVMAAIAVSAIIASGGAALIGAGIAAATLGIGGAIFGSSLSGKTDTYDTPTATGGGNATVNAKDLEIRTMPEDTIVTQAGTKLGRTEEMVKELKTNNELLKQLINSKGNVYMDGNKVGQALVLSSYQSS